MVVLLAFYATFLLFNGALRYANSRHISTTPCALRKFQKGFKTSMGACGPLIDGVDYTFIDGRPTPLRVGQRRRAQEQREVSAKVIQLMKETKFAIERQKSLQLEKQKIKQQFLEEKLKPKGYKLLQQ
nr:39S ribosomal protein L52, mitochondrial-like isoform X1 [Procambarus clarkii]